ncbi:MAG: hypothetical protein HN600_12475 [Bacteroidetes bacterium]|nr:hypothetical protein [Bacteroidota bacterium]
MRSHQVDFIKDRIRLAYKESLDSRGRADLTVRNYKMRAPLVLSGEHKLSEPAIMERVICGAFDQDLKSEVNASYTEHFNLVKTFHLQGFLPRYIQWSLGQDIGEYFGKAEKYLTTLDFYRKAPSRTKLNLACLYCGLELWIEYGKQNAITPQDIPYQKVFNFQKEELNLSDAGRHKRDVDILLETLAILAEREDVKDGVEYIYKKSISFGDTNHDKVVLIRVKPTVGALRKYKQQTGDDINVMDEFSFRSQIKGAPYYIGFDKFSYKGRQHRWCVLDYDIMDKREMEIGGFKMEFLKLNGKNDIFESKKNKEMSNEEKEKLYS